MFTCQWIELSQRPNKQDGIEYHIAHNGDKMPEFLRTSLLSMRSLSSPLYLLGPPLLVLVSIPLAIFAIITTSIAISILTIRVSIVYFDLGIALMQAWIFPPPHKPAPRRPSRRASPSRTRNRRSSVASTTSSQDTAVPNPPLHHKSGSFASILGSSEITRDFEGVGGWRMSGNDDEEALWMGINSRLELPAALPKRRHHQRSSTGGSQTQRYSWSPDAVRMSPMQSRARTPVHVEGKEDYFYPNNGGSIIGMRPLSMGSDAVKISSMADTRRKSASGSSTSSGGSNSRRASSAMKLSGE